MRWLTGVVPCPSWVDASTSKILELQDTQTAEPIDSHFNAKTWMHPLCMNVTKHNTLMKEQHRNEHAHTTRSWNQLSRKYWKFYSKSSDETLGSREKDCTPNFEKRNQVYVGPSWEQNWETFFSIFDTLKRSISRGCFLNVYRYKTNWIFGPMLGAISLHFWDNSSLWVGFDEVRWSLFIVYMNYCKVLFISNHVCPLKKVA